MKAALDAGERFALVDSRGEAAWRQGRVPGAIHLPTAEIAERAAELIAAARRWSSTAGGPDATARPGQRSIQSARLRVHEMIGGFEYWAREGLGIVDDHGPIERADRRTDRARSGRRIDCDC